MRPATLLAHLWWLFHQPRRYFSMWRAALWGNRTSVRALAGGVYAAVKAPVFADECTRRRAMHLHAHWANHPACAAMLVHLLTDLPFSFTAHAHDLYVDQAMLKEKVEAARFVATVSHFNRRLINSTCGTEPDNVYVIRCGAHVERFAPSTGNRVARPFSMVCVASLRDYKGHAHLLQACARLKADGQEFKLRLIGDGELRADVEAQIERLGLGEQVELLGHLPHDRVARVLAESHLAVLASVVTPSGKMEGVPVFLMEAMAAGVPVIATDVSGIGELVEDGVTGTLVLPADGSLLADAIAKAMQEPDRTLAMAESARRRVLEEFSLASNVAKLAALFRAVDAEAASLVDKRSRARASRRDAVRSSEARSAERP